MSERCAPAIDPAPAATSETNTTRRAAATPFARHVPKPRRAKTLLEAAGSNVRQTAARVGPGVRAAAVVMGLPDAAPVEQGARRYHGAMGEVIVVDGVVGELEVLRAAVERPRVVCSYPSINIVSKPPPHSDGANVAEARRMVRSLARVLDPKDPGEARPDVATPCKAKVIVLVIAASNKFGIAHPTVQIERGHGPHGCGLAPTNVV